jgi:hypothetical protein
MYIHKHLFYIHLALLLSLALFSFLAIRSVWGVMLVRLCVLSLLLLLLLVLGHVA